MITIYAVKVIESKTIELIDHYGYFLSYRYADQVLSKAKLENIGNGITCIIIPIQVSTKEPILELLK